MEGRAGSEPDPGAQDGASRAGEGLSPCIRVISGPSLESVTERGTGEHYRGSQWVRSHGTDTNKDSQDLQRRASQDILELLASGLLP